MRLSTDFRGIFDISIFASVRLGFPCKIQIHNNLLLYIHNKTPNALLFNSGAKLLCSVKCVRKPDAQTHSIMRHLPLRLIKGTLSFLLLGGDIFAFKLTNSEFGGFHFLPAFFQSHSLGFLQIVISVAFLACHLNQPGLLL